MEYKSNVFIEAGLNKLDTGLSLLRESVDRYKDCNTCPLVKKDYVYPSNKSNEVSCTALGIVAGSLISLLVTLYSILFGYSVIFGIGLSFTLTIFVVFVYASINLMNQIYK